MAFSAWKICFHPRLTAEVMDSLEEAVSDRDSALEELHRALEEARKENAALSAKIAAAAARREALEAELAERIEADENIRRFEKTLEKFEDMKRSYESRISRLRAMVSDLKGRLSEHPAGSNELLEIDMREGTPVDSRQQASSSDWLETLHDDI